MVEIQTRGDVDWSSYYELWEGAQAVYGICLRIGKTGKAIQRGIKPHHQHSTVSVII